MFEFLPLSLSNELPIVFLVLTDFYIRPAPLQFKILDTEIKPHSNPKNSPLGPQKLKKIPQN